MEPTSSIKKETLAESYARRGRANYHINDDLLRSKSPHQTSGTNEKRTSIGPGRFRSKSSDKRDHSLRSAVSKDDVMPCYKYKVDGRKRNDIEYQPIVSLMSYLQPVQVYDQQSSSACNDRGRGSGGSTSPLRSRKTFKSFR